MGLAEQTFTIKGIFAEDLKDAGLQLQLAKSQCYITEKFRNEECEVLQGDTLNGVHKDLNGETVTTNGNAFHCITTCNLPIREEGFVKGYIKQKMTKITRGFDKIVEFLNPGRWPHP